jgi:glycosyltransferase domain-containing protein
VTETLYTLIVPTYNRPELLARLLGFLGRQGARFAVLVLDSSRDEVRVINAACVAKSKLSVQHVEFDPTMHPFEKFWRGAQRVATEYCGMCADDDLVLVDGIEKIVSFLETHPEHSLAHGWYFTFYLQGAFGITSIVYRHGLLEQDDPIQRLHAFFSPYEALTYGVFRTRIAQEALSRVQSLPSIMARELLEGALTVIAGKVSRVPVFYYGRALGDSAQYEHWHPIDFLITSPEVLFDEYVKYREILVDFCRVQGHLFVDPRHLVKMVDLIHLRYLSDYCTPAVMDYLVREAALGTSRAQVMQGLWPVLAASSSILERAAASSWIRRLRDTLAPRLRRRHLDRLFGAANYLTRHGTTLSGLRRDNHVYRPFLDSVSGQPGLYNGVDRLLETLKAYE